MQQEGRGHAASHVEYTAEDSFARLSMHLEKAYPAEAGLVSWKRILTLKRGKEVTLQEQYELSQAGSGITLSLMTPCQVERTTAGTLQLRHADGNAPVYLHFESEKMSPELEVIPVSDKGLQSVWGPRLTRILLHVENPPIQSDYAIRIASS